MLLIQGGVIELRFDGMQGVRDAQDFCAGAGRGCGGMAQKMDVDVKSAR
jgi:hypothetical protein